jgi:FlaG/FlaF family flagellin (archaellin)
MLATLAVGVAIGIVLAGVVAVFVVRYMPLPEPESPPQRVGAIGVDLSGRNNGGLIDIHYHRMLAPILERIQKGTQI